MANKYEMNYIVNGNLSHCLVGSQGRVGDKFVHGARDFPSSNIIVGPT